jgi:TetR/AcrR family transcriptional regulator, ethionamide resistance regulator
VSSTPGATPSGRRARHDPRETEREILDAAEQFLHEHPFRELTVPAVMARTGSKRPAFYVHFRDRHDLVLRVVDRIRGELLVVANRWFEGGETVADLRSALEGVAAVYVEHGPVLRALADASGSDPTVDTAYRTLVEGFIEATARRIRAEQATGRIGADIDPDETARALVWLNESYLRDALGRPPIADTSTVVDVIERIWTTTLYSPDADDVRKRTFAAGPPSVQRRTRRG